MAERAYRLKNGWFEEVYGLPVEKVDCLDLPHTSFTDGKPLGIMWHLTAGCTDNLRSIWVSKGLCGSTLSIGRGAQIFQYLPLPVSAFHARAASSQYWGVEHTGLPPSCLVTDDQLEASVKVFAALIIYAKRKWGVEIPVRRFRGCGLNQRGIKEHRDGAVPPPHCDWNPAVHVDGLESHTHWTWKRYLTRLQAVLSGEVDELDEKQAKQLAETADFTRGLVRGLLGMPLSGQPSNQEKNAHKAGKKLAQGLSGSGGGGG